MLTRVDLTLDCAKPELLAGFWKARGRVRRRATTGIVRDA